jgi:hypothetical protein
MVKQRFPEAIKSAFAQSSMADLSFAHSLAFLTSASGRYVSGDERRFAES